MREFLSNVDDACAFEITMGQFLREVGSARTYKFTTRRQPLRVVSSAHSARVPDDGHCGLRFRAPAVRDPDDGHGLLGRRLSRHYAGARRIGQHDRRYRDETDCWGGLLRFMGTRARAVAGSGGPDLTSLIL